MSSFDIHPAVAKALERQGLEFLSSFLGTALEQQPGNLLLVGELANILTQLGRYEEGLSLDRRLVAEVPKDPMARYNLACSYALLGRTEQALAELEQAVSLGYDDGDFLQQDEDLASLRSEPRYLALVQRLSRKQGFRDDASR